ncbi:phosphoesterase, RecJ-like protein [Rhodotorula toruloides]|uniref:Phosphoesterase, RecJ-like protein n=1 Tax=Rhodotorula toruloides TaxID=5286 RepID=A0A511KLK9_RHOTO|nr:phosphoesterase, RecJ-like protein [Rhodotorula toruloides]
MDQAKDWISECVRDKHRVLICPDKDADGLSSALVLSRTLRALSHPPSLTAIYHLPRGLNIHSPQASAEMLSSFPTEGGPTRCIVLDQGSRPGPALLPPDQCKTLIIDHHLSDSFPAESQVLSACHSLPVATTSLLTYSLCAELVPELRGKGALALGALVGVYGDLGSGKVKFGSPDDPWPASLAPAEKALTKSALSKSVALLNAPRRTPEFNVASAYAALEAAGDAEDETPGTGLKSVLGDEKLLGAKERTAEETKRWQAAPPVFTKDGRIAVVTVDSGYQIHPVIATRWTGTLRKAKTLICVMCANTGYTPSHVHFSCRAPRQPGAPPPDLIAFLTSLKPLCDALSPGWSERVGDDFARGHREATGGIIRTEEWEVLCKAVELGVKKEKSEGASGKGAKGKVIDPGQKNTLDGFFAVKGKKKECKAIFVE